MRTIRIEAGFLVAARTLFNLGVSYKYQQWNVRVEVENLFNKDYIQSAGSRNTLVPGLPRNWSLSLAYKF